MNPDLMYVLLVFISAQNGAISSFSAEFSQKESCEAAGTQYKYMVPRDVRVSYTCSPKAIGMEWNHEG